MAVSVTIRNVPNEARDALASKAAAEGRSLQEHLRMLLIESADKADIKAMMAQVRKRKTAVSSMVETEEILAARDLDRA